MLALVTCHFNPLKYRRALENYNRFRDALGHEITTVELSFDDEFEIEDAIHIRGDERNLMWQKERLLNLAIASLPEQVDQIAWLDSDFLFLNKNWFEQAERMLDDFAAIQLVSHFHFTDRQGEIVRVAESFAHSWRQGRFELRAGGHGGAWAARRAVIPQGIYDGDIIGGGDTALIHAWTGRPHSYGQRWARLPKMQGRFLKWAETHGPLVDGSIGCVPGDAIHLWHGDRKHRQYVSRSHILTRHLFDPRRDIRIGTNGVWEWCSDKPQLHREVREYFQNRREDG